MKEQGSQTGMKVAEFIKDEFSCEYLALYDVMFLPASRASSLASVLLQALTGYLHRSDPTVSAQNAEVNRTGPYL